MTFTIVQAIGLFAAVEATAAGWSRYRVTGRASWRIGAISTIGWLAVFVGHVTW